MIRLLAAIDSTGTEHLHFEYAVNAPVQSRSIKLHLLRGPFF